VLIVVTVLPVVGGTGESGNSGGSDDSGFFDVVQGGNSGDRTYSAWCQWRVVTGLLTLLC
jgi:hypothetical protein